ncbi:MAG: YifB family Mg chelatase-like AAA ATPase [Elusimicrobia bacterium]|nr:YifB family Mg chelatase-like AAA ATPase [Elusimicrobiota bacterium]
MLSCVHSAGVKGVEGYSVLVQLDLANGLPGYTTVGLPDNAVRESRERVVSALRNSGYRMPSKRITVNLAPAQSRKEGTHYDLPIALALLSASRQILMGPCSKDYCFIGELGLDGALVPVPGVLAMALEAKAKGFKVLVVPLGNAREASASGLQVYAIRHLREAVARMTGDSPAQEEVSEEDALEDSASPCGDLADVKGQVLAKRALEIAAAGGHNLLLIGPPGIGKSMLASRLIGLLPPLSRQESLEVSRIYSVSGKLPCGGLVRQRPFRAPHHQSSAVSLTGGGPASRPGEASLAHAGVLFLDELAEFSRPALEALRQPLESFEVTVTRAREALIYPARFLLAAATNPCPCGWRGHPRKECVCTPAMLRKYLAKFSGPLLDRIDLHVEMAPLDFEEWAASSPTASAGETTKKVRLRVAKARDIQRERLAGVWGLNAYIPAKDLQRRCRLQGEALGLLEKASRKWNLSARSLDRLLKVSRTIADLEGNPGIEVRHLAEAMQFKGLERLLGGV